MLDHAKTPLYTADGAHLTGRHSGGPVRAVVAEQPPVHQPAQLHGAHRTAVAAGAYLPHGCADVLGVCKIAGMRPLLCSADAPECKDLRLRSTSV